MKKETILGALLLLFLLSSLAIGFMTLLNQTPTAPLAPTPKAAIAMVSVYGVIEAPGSRWLPPWIATDLSTLQLTMERLKNSDEIKAVILHIDSPGGSIAVVQEVASTLTALRNRGVLVVAALSDVAVAGAYYIACQANYIVALPGTLTGGFGVYSAMTQSEASKDAVNDLARQFIETVEQRRAISISVQQMPTFAGLLSGRQAQSFKLVDELGGLSDALRYTQAELQHNGAAPATIASSHGFNHMRELVLRYCWRPLLGHWLSCNRQLFRVPAWFFSPAAAGGNSKEDSSLGLGSPPQAKATSAGGEHGHTGEQSNVAAPSEQETGTASGQPTSP